MSGIYWTSTPACADKRNALECECVLRAFGPIQSTEECYGG